MVKQKSLIAVRLQYSCCIKQQHIHRHLNLVSMPEVKQLDYLYHPKKRNTFQVKWQLGTILSICYQREDSTVKVDIIVKQDTVHHASITVYIVKTKAGLLHL